MFSKHCVSETCFAHTKVRCIEGSKGKGKGVVETAIFKRKLRDIFITEKMGEFTWSDSIKTKLTNVTDSHKEFREKVSVPGTQASNLAWRAGWPESAVVFLELIEDRPMTMMMISHVCNANQD